MATFFSRSEADTISFAKEYAKTLCAGDVLLLDGEMGAGKTAFVKGLAQGLQIEEEVTSPTYAYMNCYGDRLYHYDCYRIQSEMQAECMGLADPLSEEKICVLEWSENIAGLLPPNCKRVVIEKISDGERMIRY